MKIFFLLISFFLNSAYLSGQTFYPNAVCDSNSSLKITRVVRDEYRTRIDFEYLSKEPSGRYIFLSPAGSEAAHYIIANEKRYELIATEGIGNKDGTTEAWFNKPVEFTAIFPALPEEVKVFDLFQNHPSAWNFKDVILNTGYPIQSQYAMDTLVNNLTKLLNGETYGEIWHVDSEGWGIFTVDLGDFTDFRINQASRKILYTDEYSDYFFSIDSIAVEDVYLVKQKEQNVRSTVYPEGNIRTTMLLVLKCKNQSSCISVTDLDYKKMKTGKIDQLAIAVPPSKIEKHSNFLESVKKILEEL